MNNVMGVLRIVTPLKPPRTFSPNTPRRFCASTKSVPLPKNSLTVAIQNRAAVKPIPIPIPSTAEAITGFLLANASALPRMIQFTTIRGRNTPKAASRAGTNAFTSIWTIVTKDAIITTYAGIRTLSGMTFLKAEIAMFEQTRTIVAAIPIPIALTIEVDVARVGQVPRTSLKTGFSRRSPFVNSLRSEHFSFLAIFGTSFYC